eukprot:CAMPEP_0181323410 /NCGR_PEP_ID=MMETSP1101-20121128/19771_1 /TAXON_ID=46948 /ORGANISM="Rhodomonas abbreviata, Strain Caron Lab Isolate" /LENGTH=130 /DNA_ID=CAMNT_0023431437 /DNA_START=80 /DNA_END=473 /DNA_ORIENTATION=-
MKQVGYVQEAGALQSIPGGAFSAIASLSVHEHRRRHDLRSFGVDDPDDERDLMSAYCLPAMPCALYSGVWWRLGLPTVDGRPGLDTLVLGRMPGDEGFLRSNALYVCIASPENLSAFRSDAPDDPAPSRR